VATEKQHFLLSIKGQDPLASALPLYSNFLSVSRIGTDVQLEFIFVDINQLALLQGKMKETSSSEMPEVVGKTIAKIIMPGANFLQIREHLNTIFEALKVELQLGESVNEPNAHARSGVR